MSTSAKLVQRSAHERVVDVLQDGREFSIVFRRVSDNWEGHPIEVDINLRVSERSLSKGGASNGGALRALADYYAERAVEAPELGLPALDFDALTKALHTTGVL